MPPLHMACHDTGLSGCTKHDPVVPCYQVTSEMAVLLVLGLLAGVVFLVYLYDQVVAARRAAFKAKHGYNDVPMMAGRLPLIGHMARFLMLPDKNFHLPMFLEATEQYGKTMRLYGLHLSALSKVLARIMWAATVFLRLALLRCH